MGWWVNTNGGGVEPDSSHRRLLTSIQQAEALKIVDVGVIIFK